MRTSFPCFACHSVTDAPGLCPDCYQGLTGDPSGSKSLQDLIWDALPETLEACGHREAARADWWAAYEIHQGNGRISAVASMKAAHEYFLSSGSEAAADITWRCYSAKRTVDYEREGLDPKRWLGDSPGLGDDPYPLFRRRTVATEYGHWLIERDFLINLVETSSTANGGAK